jgi:hypothetical protein
MIGGKIRFLTFLLYGGVMKTNAQTSPVIVSTRRTIPAVLVLALALAAPLVGGSLAREREEEGKKDTDKKQEETSRGAAEKTTAKGAAARPVLVEVRYIDGSSMKLTLLEERIEFQTPYGKLLIPAQDIQRIEFAFRIPDEVVQRIEAAVADLGKEDFHRREAASAELLELHTRAYPALLKAEKSRDAEVARRARDLLEKIREEVPAERLEFRPDDVVYTAGSKNTGRLVSDKIKVRTFQFGDQQLKLADVRELRSPTAVAEEPANALPDPGNLNSLLGQVGRVYAFRVTGGGRVAAPGLPGLNPFVPAGAVWGTDIYTLDSSLAMAAVHAGVLKQGQTGVVRVKILGPQAMFTGSTRHGVTSNGYGPYTGSFQFLRAQ